MNREEAEELSQSRAFEWGIDYKPWDEQLDYREYARHGYATGFMAAYDLLTTPKSTQRSWEIVGGDETAMGDENKFTNMNKAHEALEFLQESYPDTNWELKEIN